jgi:inorganic pyrophosphatase/exopolyphosphatase
MNKIVVTTGQPFTDIDSLSCAITYTELLKNEKKDALAVLPGKFNKSITKKIKSWNFDYEKDLKNSEYKFVIVDISKKEFFPDFVEEKDIIEIYDHRHGFEDYWKVKLASSAKIEMLGACATLIWEEFEKRSTKKISTVSANLLYTAIISNTLNFNAKITDKRDREAFEKLSHFIDLSDDCVETYFRDQENAVFENPIKEIVNDSKVVKVPQFRKVVVIGQLELWDSKKFIKTHLSEVKKALESFGKDKWFLTSPSISEGINYIYTENKSIKKLLSKIIDVKFEGNIGKTKNLWLRKEILKKLYNNL